MSDPDVEKIANNIIMKFVNMSLVPIGSSLDYEGLKTSISEALHSLREKTLEEAARVAANGSNHEWAGICPIPGENITRTYVAEAIRALKEKS